jgi:hypothetical protein
MDLDAAGLTQWARTRFGVELSPDDLRDTGPSLRKAGCRPRSSGRRSASIAATDLFGHRLVHRPGLRRERTGQVGQGPAGTRDPRRRDRPRPKGRGRGREDPSPA